MTITNEEVKNIFISNENHFKIDNSGNVGIGTTTPHYPLHVMPGPRHGNGPYGTYYHVGNWIDPGSTWNSGNNIHQFNGNFNLNVGFSGNNYCAYFEGFIFAKMGMIVQSDKRIKTEIEKINDSRALDQVNTLESYEYHYIDPARKRPMKTIGFIAQDVNKVMPNAVSISNDFIPDEMRRIENPLWSIDNSGNNILTINDLDLSGNHTGNCRFYVSNDPSGNDEIMIEIKVEDDKQSFIFDKKWNNVFIWGKEVNDFHSIDKNMIFALHHSAIQELSRKNDDKTERINILEENNQELTQKYNTLEIKYNTLETENAQLKSDIALIKQQLGL